MNRLRSLLETGNPLLLAVAGSGQVAKCAVESGVDVIMALNAGVYRNVGAGSLASFLPYGNANEQTENLIVEQILPAVQGRVPVIAGVLAGDPTRDLGKQLRRLKELKIDGVTNWPAVSLIDGRIRECMEAEGVGAQAEAAMLMEAQRNGFATFGFARESEAARLFTEAGVDGLILNLGMTREVEGIREKRDQLQHAITHLNVMLATTRSISHRVRCFAFGGPATTVDDLEQLLRHSSVDGFAGGSVFERLPVNEIICATVRHFKSVTVQARKTTGATTGLGEMIGSSRPMKDMFRLVQRLAPFDVNVCLEGETGTGKELVATLIHRLSDRSHHAFVTINCGAVPESLLESELFGHEKGAFTGAHRRRLGKFELAHHGTLFLDEIADLSAHAQVALLRAIQQREITRVGGENSLPVDVRIVTATHQNLADLVRQGRFRADLYYRLNNFTLKVSPLRDRTEDIPLLVEHILARLQLQHNRRHIGVSSGFLRRLMDHSWPGNVRELQHVISQAVVLEDGPLLEGHYFVGFDGADVLPHNEPGRKSRKAILMQILAEVSGNKTAAAARLGITRKTLYAWLKESCSKSPEAAKKKALSGPLETGI